MRRREGKAASPCTCAMTRQRITRVVSLSELTWELPVEHSAQCCRPSNPKAGGSNPPRGADLRNNVAAVEARLSTALEERITLVADPSTGSRCREKRHACRQPSSCCPQLPRAESLTHGSTSHAAPSLVPSDPPAQGRRARRTTCGSCRHRGFEVAAVGLEQAGEQAVRAPIFEPVLGPGSRPTRSRDRGAGRAPRRPGAARDRGLDPVHELRWRTKKRRRRCRTAAHPRTRGPQHTNRHRSISTGPSTANSKSRRATTSPSHSTFVSTRSPWLTTCSTTGAAG